MRRQGLRVLTLFAMMLLFSQACLAGDAAQRFEKLVQDDQGLLPDQKTGWIMAVRGLLEGRRFSFDAGRFVYAVMNQAACNEVAPQRAAAAARTLVAAVEAGAPGREVSELTLFAFVEDLSVDEVRRFADSLELCNRAGVPVFVSQEMIRTAKEEAWAEGDFKALMQGLAALTRERRDPQKAALFMIVSMAQNLGTPAEILRDARAEIPSAPRVRPAPEPRPSKVLLNFDAFRQSVESFLGTPYVWGGETRHGADCSGFTQLVMQENGYRIPRVSRDQAKIGEKVDQDALKLGDLVFFDTKGEGRITHVGLYLGGNLMAHASSSKGVIIVLFSNRYFQSRYEGARRIVTYQK
ncbi:MAG: C40 family peptidase [Desulfovibrionaceae bacterium]